MMKDKKIKIALKIIILFLSVCVGSTAYCWSVLEFERGERRAENGNRGTEIGERRGTYTDPVTGMEFVWVEGGCFQMGSNNGDSDEKPVHEVCVDGFWMGRYEVTNRQYRMYKSGHDSKDYKGVDLNGDSQPVLYVSWEDAKGFIQWLNKKTGKRFALPTEAQWEYAARGGTTSIRFWGDDADQACEYANVADRTAKNKWSDWTVHSCTDGYAGTAPVGSFKPNPFGLYDILGNVWEWCEDWYGSDYYKNSPRNNPEGPGSGSTRVNRGGSWYNGPWDVRAALRGRLVPGFRSSRLGFRLVLPVQQGTSR